MTPTVFDRLRQLLKENGATFSVRHHEPVYTSEQAAEVRGTPLASGAKALVVKAGERFVLLVVPADRKLSTRKVKEALVTKGLRFATAEEVVQFTGLQPGSIPPFGSLFGLPTYCDPALGDNASINFNAGDHSISINMSFSDYATSERPTIVSLSAPSEPGN